MTPTMKTKTFNRSPFIRSSFAALSLSLLAAGTSARAQTTTAWNNAGTDWATGANWVGGAPSTTVSALFNSSFTNQPQLGTGTTTAQGLWVANGVAQDVTISTNDGTTQRTLTITGTATLSSQPRAGIIMDDSGNHNLTLGASATDPLVVAISNDTGFYVNNAGTLTLQGNKNLAIGALTLTLGGNNTAGKIVITRAINGTGSVVVNTAGTVTLSGQNTLAGTTLTAGTLNINHIKALGIAATSTFTINGGKIDNTSGAAILAAYAYPITIGGNFAFTGGSGTTHDLNLGAGAVDLTGATRTITANAGKLTLGGVVSNGSLSKAGAGTLALSGNNTFTGATTISAGTLVLASTGTIDNSSGVNLGTSGSQGTLDLTAKTNGFTLGSNQTLSGYGNVTMAAGKTLTIDGSLAPGNSPGVIGVSGNLTLGSTATTTMDLIDYSLAPGVGFDQISLSGTTPALIYGGTLTLNLTGSTQLGVYHLFTGFSSQSGTFTGINYSGGAGSFDYATGDLTLTAVPEPATWALLAVSLTTVMILRRRRQS